MAEFVTVLKASDLSPGQGTTVRVSDRAFAVFNLDGQFFAMDDDCPHRGGPLGAGVLEDGVVHCPLHGWAFDVKTGACSTNPAKPAKCRAVRIENGLVQIEAGA